MKVVKTLAALALVASSVAHAGGYGTVEYYDEHNRVTDADSVKGAVIAGFKAEDGMDYSVKLESSQAQLGNGSISSGVELRVKKSLVELNTFGLTPYIGARLGEKITSSEHFAHYAVDYGVKFPIAGALSGDIGGRYRNAFDTVNAFQSNRGHVILAYALTDKDSVAVRYSKAYGDDSEAKNSWRLSYTRSF